MTCPLLDDLFTWAAQEPVTNMTRAMCNLSTTTSRFQNKDHNLVTYGEGGLVYRPGYWLQESFFRIYVPPSFSGELTQYFSDRRYSTDPQTFINYPFAHDATDPLAVSISASVYAGYSVTIHSPNYGGSFSFQPQCAAGVIYGVIDTTELVAISLCDRSSQAPPP